MRYARHGEVPAIASTDQQALTLTPLGRFLKLEGWAVETESRHESVIIPLLATSPTGKTTAIGTHPALVTNDHAYQVHDLRNPTHHSTLLIQDYVVERDLPAAYQYIKDMAQRSPKPGRTPPTEREGVEVNLSIYDIADFASGKSKVTGKLRRYVKSPGKDFFAVRVPVAALTRLGIPQGALVVLQQPKPEDYDGRTRLLVSRTGGVFKLTGVDWTLAHVKRLTDNDGERMQISYARPEAIFRPERIRSDDLHVFGAVVEVIQD